MESKDFFILSTSSVCVIIRTSAKRQTLFLNQIVLSLALLILCLSILYNPRYITDPAKSKTDSWANVYRDERTFS